MPRSRICFEPEPLTTKPTIKTLASVPLFARTETLASRDGPAGGGGLSVDFKSTEVIESAGSVMENWLPARFTEPEVRALVVCDTNVSIEGRFANWSVA